LGFVSLETVGEITEESEGIGSEMMSGKGKNVKPDFIRNKGKGSRTFGFGIERGSSLQENIHIGVLDLFSGVKNLEANHKNVGDFISFEQTSVNVFVNMVSKIFDNLFYSFAGLLFFLGLVNGFIKEFQILFQRGVIHPTDHGHINNTEIESRTSNSHRSILFSLFIDFFGLYFGIGQFDRDIFGLRFGQIQDIHQFGIVE